MTASKGVQSSSSSSLRLGIGSPPLTRGHKIRVTSALFEFLGGAAYIDQRATGGRARAR